jgi:hypothetical protein
MARHHRQAVQPAGSGANAVAQREAPPGAAEAPGAPGPALTLSWKVALTVWALGFGGLMLFELVSFALRLVRGAGG